MPTAQSRLFVLTWLLGSLEAKSTQRFPPCADSEATSMKFNKLMGPTLRFLYWNCHSGAKLLFIVMIVANINMWEWLGQETPSWWTWFTTNKIYACMMVFFLCNAVEGQLVSTGAFEISFNDVPVWSKLETGRIPQPPELFQIIDNHVRFNQNTNTWNELNKAPSTRAKPSIHAMPSVLIRKSLRKYSICICDSYVCNWQ
ncbi:Thioredoxin reductase-like selenoprotein T [Homarus americanus]|uniref:Thioredoxin reductase-like selenoprotein T n=1 Tax=Homarus americanus TaxID=6706 RepID=A0A8J5JPA2_HOMAM|nr:Thioredoxin reductase-like selenoprotein T [Homarus americanus]